MKGREEKYRKEKIIKPTLIFKKNNYVKKYELII